MTDHAAEQSEAAHFDPVAAKTGMWLFLFTEALLFGALFIAYAVYLNLHRPEFMEASRHLDKLLGAVNTAVLLTSSLTMALSIASLRRGRIGASLALAGGTTALSLVFLGIKAHEWGEKFAHDVYPKSATMLAKAPGEQVFYGLYFAMTGLHALHVIVGAVAILFAIVFIAKGKVHPGRDTFLENVGLYWHLVDVIWIFLFPLFYLIG